MTFVSVNLILINIPKNFSEQILHGPFFEYADKTACAMIFYLLDKDFVHQLVDGASYSLVVLVHVSWASSYADALEL